MSETEVSIVIVCMNNLRNLYPCLDSIKKYTSISYETLVVAYLFDKGNLEKAISDYPWVTFIESNRTRGFSENNNIALKQAKGKYCFILNDDTEMTMPVIDLLVNDIRKLPENVATISPTVIYPDGNIQFCGRPPKNWITFILQMLHLWDEHHGKYVNQKGVFRSYNIVGAAFLIKTDVFRKYGWFDETYFFCPEDIALSTLLNKEGYGCYVDSDVRLIHHGGMTYKSVSWAQTATLPAACRGNLLFYSKGNIPKRIVLSSVALAVSCVRYIVHTIKGAWGKRPNADYIMAKGNLNCTKICFCNKTPKEIFIRFYHPMT